MKWYYTKEAVGKLFWEQWGWLWLPSLAALILASASKAQRESNRDHVFGLHETLVLSAYLTAIVISAITLITVAASLRYLWSRRHRPKYYNDFIKATASGFYWGLVVSVIVGTVLSLALLELNLFAGLFAAAEGGISLVALLRKRARSW